MFGTIRKHQTWLWIVIITVIVISFVIYFSPYSKLNTSASDTGSLGTIDGQEVTKERYAAAEREVYLRYFLMMGRWPDQDAQRMGFEPMRETYQWMLLTQKAKDLGIQPSDDAVDQQARQILAQFERMGATSPSQFFQQALQPRGLGADDFERFLRHSLAVQEMVSVVGASGKLVTPDEARALYVRNNQEIEAEAIIVNASNYLQQVTVSPEAISQHYSNRLAAYRVPDRVQVTYVSFPATNFLEEAKSALSTNIDNLVTANLQRLGTNQYRDAKTPEESRAKLREDIVRSQALTLARRRAAEFAAPLVEKEPIKPESLEQAAKEKGLPVAVTPPFSRDSEPEGIDAEADFAKAAFSRTPEEPIGGPIVGENGAYVIAVTKRIPSEIPPLDQVRGKVTRDFQENTAMNLARQAGFQAHTAITNALAQGKSFAEAAEQAKVKPVALPPFSLSTRSLPESAPDVPIQQLKQLAFGTDPGKVSNFQPTAEGGIILLVKQKLPVNEEKLKQELPAFVNNIRRSRQEEAFNDWFRKTADRALVNTPLNRPEQPNIAPKKAKS